MKKIIVFIFAILFLTTNNKIFFSKGPIEKILSTQWCKQAIQKHGIHTVASALMKHYEFLDSFSPENLEELIENHDLDTENFDAKILDIEFEDA